jgi:hypothetical protein
MPNLIIRVRDHTSASSGAGLMELSLYGVFICGSGKDYDTLLLLCTMPQTTLIQCHGCSRLDCNELLVCTT